MKRYRIWEANRKIFLFPENWLEPEFRDDKSYLFEELENALLQGDVSDELVEDAFLKYLNGLDEIARLEVVSCSADERHGTLHVSAHLQPDGTQVLLSKERLGKLVSLGTGERRHSRRSRHPGCVEEASPLILGDLYGEGEPALASRQVAGRAAHGKVVNLIAHGRGEATHWIERVDDNWTGRSSSPKTGPIGIQASQIDLSKVTIHATTSGPDSGPVLIHLGGDVQKALRLASKNGVPTVIPAQPRRRWPSRPPAKAPPIGGAPEHSRSRDLRNGRCQSLEEMLDRASGHYDSGQG